MAQAPLLIVCDICQLNKNAHWYCVDCNNTLCDNCKISHKTDDRTKHDKIVLWKDVRVFKKTEVIYCSTDTSNEIVYHCDGCRKFICLKCCRRHEDHRLTPLQVSQKRNIKFLETLKQRLTNKLSVSKQDLHMKEKEFEIQMKSLEGVKAGIADQMKRIPEEILHNRDDMLSELSSIQAETQANYKTTLNKLKAKRSKIQTEIGRVHTAMGSDYLKIKHNAVKNAKQVLENLEPDQKCSITISKFEPAVISSHAIKQLVGVLQSSAKCETTLQDHEDVDVTKVKIFDTINVLEAAGIISIIIPVENLLWVNWPLLRNTSLALIDDNGTFIKHSVKCENEIQDAKKFSQDILLTYHGCTKVMKMDENGMKISNFSDLSPYQPRGLAATQEKQVLVCLMPSDEGEAKVVRLDRNGKLLQEIILDSFNCNPFSITSLSTGEILVADQETNKVVCIDGIGEHLFTWNGEVDGGTTQAFSPSYITRDNHDNVFITDWFNGKLHLMKDGVARKCLLGTEQGMFRPGGIHVTDRRRLLLGDHRMIHIVDY